MFQVTLINMPFANAWAPSLALTQLETVLSAELPDTQPSELDAGLNSLYKQGLVFEERDRFISLVLPRETQPWFACDSEDPLAQPARPEKPKTETPALQSVSRDARRVKRSTLRKPSKHEP